VNLKIFLKLAKSGCSEFWAQAQNVEFVGSEPGRTCHCRTLPRRDTLLGKLSRVVGVLASRGLEYLWEIVVVNIAARRRSAAWRYVPTDPPARQVRPALAVPVRPVIAINRRWEHECGCNFLTLLLTVVCRLTALHIIIYDKTCSLRACA